MVIRIWSKSTIAVLQVQRFVWTKSENINVLKFKAIHTYLIIIELTILSSTRYNNIKIFHGTIIMEFTITVLQYYCNVSNPTINLARAHSLACIFINNTVNVFIFCHVNRTQNNALSLAIFWTISVHSQTKSSLVGQVYYMISMGESLTI